MYKFVDPDLEMTKYLQQENGVLGWRLGARAKTEEAIISIDLIFAKLET